MKTITTLIRGLVAVFLAAVLGWIGTVAALAAVPANDLLRVDVTVSDDTATVSLTGLQPVRDDSTLAATVWHRDADLEAPAADEILYTNALYLNGQTELSFAVSLRGNDPAEFNLSLADDRGNVAYQGPLAVSDIEVTVPAAPEQPSVTVGESVVVSWDAPADGGAPLTNYTLVLTGAAGTQLLEVAGTTTSANLGELAPGEYSVKVIARNSVGSSEPSAAAAFTVADLPGTPTPTEPGTQTPVPTDQETPAPSTTPSPSTTPGPTTTPTLTPGPTGQVPGEPIPTTDGDALTEENRGPVTVPEAAYPGQTIRVMLGGEWAEESVVIWFGDEVIAATELDGYGATRVTIPSDSGLGTVKIAVRDARGELIGWDAIEIVEESRVGENGELLAQSGAAIVPIAIAGAVIVLAGAGVLYVKRQRAQRA